MIIRCLASCVQAVLEDSLDQAADRIQSVLETYQPNQIEESVLAQAIVDALPDGWKNTGIEVIESVGDTREAAALIAVKLSQASDALDAQADLEATQTENAVFGVMSVAELLLGTNGLIAGIAGVLWKKKKQSDRASEESRLATEDIVNSIRSSPIMTQALDNGGGVQVRASMQSRTMRIVKTIKETT
ncbi:hypothetical protein COB72_01940 [bacterium]|nr:MAG: hypothetical protein COB72_01940 [bacterium]